MRSALALPLAAVALLALAGCDQKPKLRPAAEAAPPAPAAASPDPVLGKAPGKGEWVFGLGKNSAEMAHLAVGGDASKADLRLVCARGDGFMAALPTLTPAAGETRLTIGAGEQAQSLGVTPAKQGVQAVGPIAEPLLRILEGDIPIVVSHGDKRVGPFAAPPEAVRRAFVTTCRRLNLEGRV